MRWPIKARGICALAFLALSANAQAFDCAPTKCPDIASCAEAHYKLTTCGHTERDADRDGIPCESNLCGDDQTAYRNRVIAQWPKDSPPPNLANTDVLPALIPEAKADEPADFSCSTKKSCKQMSSCEEAKFYLESCGRKSLDGDGDGVPCNALCR